MLITAVGLFAAICTTTSYLPQVMKCWKTGKTHDLSLKMLLLLAAGLSSWVAYGFLNGDWVIVTSNLVSLALLANVLGFKVIEVAGAKRNRDDDKVPVKDDGRGIATPRADRQGGTWRARPR